MFTYTLRTFLYPEYNEYSVKTVTGFHVHFLLSLKLMELISPYDVLLGGFPQVLVIFYISIFYEITPELKGRTNGYTLPQVVTFSSFPEDYANNFCVCEAHAKLAAKVCLFTRRT